MIWDGFGEGAQLTTQARPIRGFLFHRAPNQSEALWVEGEGQI